MPSPLGLILLLAIGLLLAWALLVLLTAWRLTHPPRRTGGWAVARSLPSVPAEVMMPDGDPVVFASWTLRSRGRDLPVWDIVGRCADGPIVVFTPGWAESRVTSLSRLPTLLSRASRVIMWDPPGLGDAPGVCSLGVNEPRDLAELVSVVRGRAGDEPIVLAGFSYGAGVSIAAAKDCRAAMVIAEAPYRRPATPATGVLTSAGLPVAGVLTPALRVVGLCIGAPAGWLDVTGGFERVSHARGLRCPLVVIHPELDEICPPEDGREIARAASDSEFVLIPGARHTEVWSVPAFAAIADNAVATALSRVATKANRPASGPIGA